MLDESGSIKCEVIVDGELLPEYNDNLDDGALVDADPNTMETYVEAETGKKFECRVVFQKGWKKVFKVHDNPQMGMGGPIRLSKLQSFSNHNVCQERELIFPALHIIEDAPSQSGRDTMHETAKDRGIIKIAVHNVQLLEKIQPEPDFEVTRGFVQTFSEKTLKGSLQSHSAEYDLYEQLRDDDPLTISHRLSAATQRRCSVHDVRYVQDKPVATFIFKCRSMDALKALRIVPRTPSPVSLEDRDINTLSFDELRELAYRHKEQQEIRAKVKRERPDEDDNGDALEIVSQRKKPRLSNDPLCPVDLTNED